MKDNDIDNLLREKAKQIDDNKYNFKINVDEIKRKADSKRRGNIIKISFTSVLCACLLLGALFFISRNSKAADNNVIIQGNDDVEDKEKEDVFKSEEIVDTIVNDDPFTYIGDELPTNILIIKVESVDNNESYSKPETIIKANVIESLKGEEKGNIIVLLESSIVNSNNLPDSKKEKFNYEEKSKIRIVLDDRMENTAYPEVDKMYLVTTNKENKVINRCIYPFYEYDPDTKKVKIGDQWQDIDFNYIVW